MTQINPNINQYNNMQYRQQQANPQQQPVRIPSYYYVPENSLMHKSFKETIKDADPMGVITPFIEHPFLVLATWLGMGFGIDAYAKACGGKYEDSLVKKAANLGDSIENSKLVQSKPVQTVLDGFKAVKKKGGKVVQNSAILRAMRDTPSMPEWSMVKSQMFNQKQEVVQDFIKIADTLMLGQDKKESGFMSFFKSSNSKLEELCCPQLKNLGLTSAEKNMLKSTFNVAKVSEIAEEKAVVQVLLNRLGRSPEEIKKIQTLGDGAVAATKKEILKEMGLSAKQLNEIKEDMFGKHIKTVEDAAKRVSGKVKIGAGNYSKWMGPLTKPFERTVGCDEVYNKLHSLSKEGTKTATGRFMSKAMQMFHRGITFGGGKLGALLFIAPVLVEVGCNVKKADNDQKIGTAVGGVIESASWVLTFPLALRMMHSLCGAQYAGMTKKQVEEFRNALNEFNEKALAGGFANKAEYKIAKQEVKNRLKVPNQNIFTKGIRKLAQFVTMDLETFKGFKGKSGAGNFARTLPNFFKNVGGVPMRLIMWGMISMGLLDAVIKKTSSTIFGKSYDSMKHEEEEEAKKEQKRFLAEDLNRRLYEAQRNKQYGKQAQPQQINNNQGQMIATRGKDANSNVIPQAYQVSQTLQEPQEFHENEKVDNYTYIPSSENIIPHKIKKNETDNYTYIPSSECKIPNEKTNENQRKYIPSQAAANIQKTFDNSGLQSALDRAQKAEDKALRVLAGNFDNM